MASFTFNSDKAWAGTFFILVNTCLLHSVTQHLPLFLRFCPSTCEFWILQDSGNILSTKTAYEGESWSFQDVEADMLEFGWVHSAQASIGLLFS